MARQCCFCFLCLVMNHKFLDCGCEHLLQDGLMYLSLGVRMLGHAHPVVERFVACDYFARGFRIIEFGRRECSNMLIL